ncbi:hypothetical protein CTEN210_08931 [Chaetoceros tenuissimus]|uniref:Uncharacterized protein n=1 Tax=Chaetoceros tenuissimus TaxID=426638 RepID=A0AAD3CWV8_9STRA|nr:hypothetical protein CTEN210_08931 [Chaetoceros tenuissimus]
MATTKKSKDEKLNQTKEQNTTATAKDETKSNSTKKESPKKKNENGSENDDQGIDVKIPLSLLMTGTSSGNNECSVLVQVTPEDAPTLDFHGAGGAIGRFELNQDTVVMDLKGFQYQGYIQPGPTCLVASMHPMIGENVMKIESISDEFIAIQKTGDQFMQMDAIVDKGELDDSFVVKDVNVNRRGSAKDTAAAEKDKKGDKGKKNKASGSSATKKPSKRRKK